MDEISIAIIGGGVVGCAVARELSRNNENIFLFEKNYGITQGENQSSRNSGVIHSGIYYDQETRPQKASLCVEGNRLLYDFCRSHRVPAMQTGKLIVAVTAEEDRILDFYLDLAGKNKVPGVKKIDARMIGKLEPNVRARSALVVPSAGIVEPVSLVYRLHTLARQSGVQFMVGTRVAGISWEKNYFALDIIYNDGAKDHIRAQTVINAAGVDADRVARLLDSDSTYELDPVRGESYKFYSHKRPELSVAGKNIYPTPESVITPHGRHFTVGIHLTPTFEDLSYPPRLGSTITIGPRLTSIDDRDDWLKDQTRAGIFFNKVRPFFPGLTEEDLIRHQAGLQARLKGYPDFIIRPNPRFPRFINLLGIDSPGLTASLSIAGRVADMINNYNE